MYTVTTIDQTKDHTWPAEVAEDYTDLVDLLDHALEAFRDDFQSIENDRERARLRSKARRLQQAIAGWYEDHLDDELEADGVRNVKVDDGGKGTILRIELEKTPAS